MKCKRCQKSITRNSVTGLCRYCRHYIRQKKYRESLQKQGLCLSCRKKVEPVIIYPEGPNGIQLIKQYTKCFACRERMKKYHTKVVNKI